MLIVSGVFEVEPEDRMAAIDAARVMAEATRHEPGCHSYAFYADVEDPTRIRVFEEWQDGAALESHFQAPQMAEFRQTLAQVRIRSRAIFRYEVAEKNEL